MRSMRKILIIDDDKIFVKIFRDTMHKTHASEYEIVSAENGEDGLEKIEESRPDLIVVDLKMPKMGGLEFLKILKEKKYDPPISVLISSNFSDPEHISEGLEFGVAGYVVKSDYSMESIVQRIDDVLGVKHDSVE